MKETIFDEMLNYLQRYLNGKRSISVVSHLIHILDKGLREEIKDKLHRITEQEIEKMGYIKKQ